MPGLTVPSAQTYTLIAMEQNIRQKLLEINGRFYKQFAPSFSATRGRIQPGVRQLLPRLLEADQILDVG
ncbi:MAG: hypothetical protein SVR81_08045, partial [Chloroflexota bacterium]|nr:hypothetical protein [Chloroflexota bacterium]